MYDLNAWISLTVAIYSVIASSIEFTQLRNRAPRRTPQTPSSLPSPHISSAAYHTQTRSGLAVPIARTQSLARTH